MDPLSTPDDGLKGAGELFEFIELCTGYGADGKPFYVYLRLTPEKYQALRAAPPGAAAFRPEDYGEVLARGQGLEPPAEIKAEMAQRFGANPRFEEEFVAELRRLLAPENPAAGG